MRGKRKSVSVLVTEAVAWMEQSGEYRKSSIETYSKVWKRLLVFLDGSKDSVCYSQELGVDFISHIEKVFTGGDITAYQRHLVRSMRILGDFEKHGFIPKGSYVHITSWANDFGDILNRFKQHERDRDVRDSSIFRMEQVLEKLFCYLYNAGIHDCADIRRSHLCGFIDTLAGYAQNTVALSIFAVDCFFKYLREEGIDSDELIGCLPKIKRKKHQHVPATWTEEEVQSILNCIDRGHPCGKRDYAILLTIARLGLRKGDILNLTFDSIDWDKNTLSLTQQKTDIPLTLPLLPDVGEAIIEYLRNGRPVSDLPFVFLKQVPPYEKMNDCYMLLDAHQKRAGIKADKGRSRGPHAFRHSLAARLLEQGVSVETVADILGHTSLSSTVEYLRIDIKALAECAIDPEGVMTDGLR